MDKSYSAYRIGLQELLLNLIITSASSDILTSLNWTNLETRRTQQLKTFMYKINNMVPSYLSRKFTSTSMIHEHSLRGSNHKRFVPRPLTESLKKTFSYRGATLWNDIPVELTIELNLSLSLNLKYLNISFILVSLHV